MKKEIKKEMKKVVKKDMTDLGILGKWSEESLKANLKKCYIYGKYHRVSVPLIEDIIKKMYKDNYANKKLKINSYNDLKDALDEIKRRDEFYESEKLYRKLMKELY